MSEDVVDAQICVSLYRSLRSRSGEFPRHPGEGADPHAHNFADRNSNSDAYADRFGQPDTDALRHSHTERYSNPFHHSHPQPGDQLEILRVAAGG